MRSAALLVLVATGCIDVDAYAPVSPLAFAPLAVAVSVPAAEDLPNRIGDGYALADVDGDGLVDLAYFAEDGTLSLHRGEGGGQFGPRLVSDAATVRAPARDVLAADLDGDGAAELIVAPVDAWRWDARAGALRRLDAFQPAYPPIAGSVAADIDGNGKPEIWYEVAENAMEIAEWDGAHLSHVGRLEGTRYDTSVVTLDVDGDGGLDLVAFPVETSFAYVLVLWHGPQPWANSSRVSCGSTISAITIADVDGDGTSDLVAGDGLGNLSWCRGHGDRSYDPPIAIGSLKSPVYLGSSDFDRDRRPDLMAASAAIDSELVVLRNEDSRRFDPLVVHGELPMFPQLSYVRLSHVVPFDLDGDHLVDLVVWNGDGLSWLKNVSR